MAFAPLLGLPRRRVANLSSTFATTTTTKISFERDMLLLLDASWNFSFRKTFGKGPFDVSSCVSFGFFLVVSLSPSQSVEVSECWCWVRLGAYLCECLRWMRLGAYLCECLCWVRVGA